MLRRSMVLPLLFGLGVSMSTAFADVVPMDGTWEGTDSTGRTFSFEVRNMGTTIEIKGFSANYKCKKADTGLFRQLFTGTVATINTETGRFTWSSGMNGPKRAEALANAAYLVRGTFDDATNAGGTLQAWRATFKGKKFKAEGCEQKKIRWTAKWVSA